MSVASKYLYLKSSYHSRISMIKRFCAQIYAIILFKMIKYLDMSVKIEIFCNVLHLDRVYFERCGLCKVSQCKSERIFRELSTRLPHMAGRIIDCNP